MTIKKPALGRGLGALIQDNTTSYPVKEVTEAISTGAITEIELTKIEPNPDQPRKNFDETALNELAESIKKLGVITPITLRLIDDNKYQLISGERRFRAAKIAGLNKIIAYVRDTNDEDMLTVALVENIQREDLNAMEIALSYQRLIDECNFTQEQVSDKVGKKRATVNNYLRLLRLPAEIQAGIRDQLISMGHARTLITVEDPIIQIDIYNKIINDELSVRNVEALVRELTNPNDGSKLQKVKKSSNNNLPEHFVSFKDNLTRHFQNIELKRDEKGKGKLIIPFTSDDEFIRISELLAKLDKN